MRMTAELSTAKAEGASSIPRSKMVRERQGEKVGENCMVEQCLQSDTQAVGKKGFGDVS